jgi:formylmethanofuran dehydrogenase subunit E
MSDTFQDFFRDADEILLKEPLAETLGAFVGAGTGVPGTFSYTFADVVKLAGHACPTMAGSYLCCQAALRALYPQGTPVRGEVAVTVFGDPDEGTYGVMSQAFTLLTGAAPATGFKGLGPLFKRKDLLKFSREKPDPQSMCFEFRRVDTGKAVLVKFSPRQIPFPAEKSKRMGELMEKVVWDAARPEERAEFQTLWMEKVRVMLVEKKGIETWLAVQERSS